MSLPATPRLLVEQDLAAGQTIPFSCTQAHYLQRVLRRRHGDSVRLFNGRDGEWLAHIDTKASEVAGHLQSQLREQPPPPAPLTLFFAPIKRTRQEILIEKAVEMGATILQPVKTRYTDGRLIKPDRARAIIREAVEQSEGLHLPELLPEIPLQKAVSNLPDDLSLYFCAESGTAIPLASALNGRTPLAGAAFLIGPEGGFSEAEIEGLKTRPETLAVGLGPRILRAETAVTAALALWQALCGDGENRPDLRLPNKEAGPTR